MKLPHPPQLRMDWPDYVESDWSTLFERAEKHAQSSGGGDAFDSMCHRLANAIHRNDSSEVHTALKKRLGARVLTWLWCNDKAILKRSCKVLLLDSLVQQQQPRLTRTTFLQLCQLYFQEFDQLERLESGLFEKLESVLREQSERMPRQKNVQGSTDPIRSIQQNIDWLVGINGPARFSQQVRESGAELEQKFVALGLVGYDNGRYADLCRAHYYIETLKQLEVGQWDPVFDELLKPSVNRAPFGEDKRIGHVALEILIDRAGSEVSEQWQEFVLGVAGDPRIYSSATNYQEWWKPLGADRVEKVRGWLSREDLKLFLKALEQYGIESGNSDLQRMFPARKRFLEGLYNQKLIRNTRLMLGRSAESIVKRLLGDEIKTNFAVLEGGLSDKAIIYVDCGSFYLVEGSHNFKIWVYLAPPGKIVPSYDYSSFSHSDLTQITPGQYDAMYDLPHDAVTHNGPWQSKVINFLAEHGVELDIESLLSRAEYRGHLARHGYPVVKSKVKIPEPKDLPGHLHVRPPQHVQRRAPQRHEDLFSHRKSESAADRFLRSKPLASSPYTKRRGFRNEPKGRQETIDRLPAQQKTVLSYLAQNPDAKARHVAALLGYPLKEIVAMFAGPLAPFVVRRDIHTWAVKPEFINKFK